MSTPKQDRQTVTPAGESTEKLPAGVSFHDVVTHVDERGLVCEMFDPRWGWHMDPVVFSYVFTIRPGIIKGWGLHIKT
jgi:dTDP-4-dehydrorhamnose 3,5-epimerase